MAEDNKDDPVQSLKERGYAVIPNVLTPDECARMIELTGELVEKLAPGLSMDNPGTWGEWLKMLPAHSMLQQSFGTGQSRMMWWLRTRPNVQAQFRRVWNMADEESLITSYDAVSVCFPPELVGKGWFSKEWLHADQSFLRKDLECFQSWITPLPVDEGDGTLLVLEGSHQLHGPEVPPAELDKGHVKDDWNLLKQHQIDWYAEKGCRKVAIQCPAGSMVLWDSRTIHCGREPVRGRSASGRLRIVGYVCMVPRDRYRITPDVIKRRAQAITKGRSMSHNPVRPRTFNALPHCWNSAALLTVRKGVNVGMSLTEILTEFPEAEAVM